MTPESRQQLLQTCYQKLAENSKLVKIFVMGNDVVFIPESILRISSSFLSEIFGEASGFSKKLMIVLPDVDKVIVECLKDILLKGEGCIKHASNLKDVKVAAENLGISLGILTIGHVETTLVVKDEPVLPTSEKIKVEPAEYFESEIETTTLEDMKQEHIEVEENCDEDKSDAPKKSPLIGGLNDLSLLHFRTPSPPPLSSKVLNSPSPKQEEKHKRHKEQGTSNVEMKSKIPISKLPELKYIYISRFHKQCGRIHNRLDFCDKMLPHSLCGKKHGFGRECDGSWMSLPKFESVALKWPSTLRERRNLAIKHLSIFQRSLQMM